MGQSIGDDEKRELERKRDALIGDMKVLADTPCDFQRVLTQNTTESLKQATESIIGEGDPREILRRSLSALSVAEANYFLVTNVLERLKQAPPGASGVLKSTVQRFKEIGFLDHVGEDVSTLQTRGAPPPSGSYFEKLRAKIREFAGWLVKVAVAACNAVEGIVTIKPSVGTGALAWPFISLQFEFSAEVDTAAVVRFANEVLP